MQRIYSTARRIYLVKRARPGRTIKQQASAAPTSVQGQARVSRHRLAQASQFTRTHRSQSTAEGPQVSRPASASRRPPREKNDEHELESGTPASRGLIGRQNWDWLGATLSPARRGAVEGGGRRGMYVLTKALALLDVRYMRQVIGVV